MDATEELIDLLNKIPAGTFVVCAIGIISIILAANKTIGWIYNKIKNKTRDEIESENELNKLTNSVNTLSDSIEQLTLKVEDIGDKQHEQNIKFTNKITELENQFNAELSSGDELFMELKDQYDNINKSVCLINKNQNLLLESNRNQLSSYITAAYYKAEVEKYISMLELSILEKEYADYLNLNGHDEYISEMMKELREFPHTK